MKRQPIFKEGIKKHRGYYITLLSQAPFNYSAEHIENMLNKDSFQKYISVNSQINASAVPAQTPTAQAVQPSSAAEHIRDLQTRVGTRRAGLPVAPSEEAPTPQPYQQPVPQPTIVQPKPAQELKSIVNHAISTPTAQPAQSQPQVTPAQSDSEVYIWTDNNGRAQELHRETGEKIDVTEEIAPTAQPVPAPVPTVQDNQYKSTTPKQLKPTVVVESITPEIIPSKMETDKYKDAPDFEHEPIVIPIFCIAKDGKKYDGDWHPDRDIMHYDKEFYQRVGGGDWVKRFNGSGEDATPEENIILEMLYCTLTETPQVKNPSKLEQIIQAGKKPE